MSDSRSFKNLIRDGISELVALAREVDIEDLPLGVLGLVAFHETGEYTKRRISETECRLNLPDSPLVLGELWRETIDVRKHLHDLASAHDEHVELAYERLERPDVITPGDVRESKRKFVRSHARPRPPATLLRRCYAPQSPQEEDEEKKQILADCPFTKRLMERIEHGDFQSVNLEREEASNRSLLDRCPSFRKFRELNQESHSTIALEQNGDAPDTSTEDLSDCSHAVIDAFLLRPFRELSREMLNRFEKGPFLEIVDKVEHTLAPPASLPAPVASISASTTGGEKKYATPAPRSEATPSEPPIPLTEEALALKLRSLDKPTEAALVECMVGKKNETALEVGRIVHDDDAALEKTIRANCRRTNADAESLGSPFRYRLSSGVVFKTS
jgi:hypothetical protein